MKSSKLEMLAVQTFKDGELTNTAIIAHRLMEIKLNVQILEKALIKNDMMDVKFCSEIIAEDSRALLGLAESLV